MKNRNKNSPQKFFPFAVLIFFIILFSLSTALYLSFRKSPFFFLQRVNFVLATKKGLVMVFSFQNKEGLILNLLEKNKVIVTRGFGEYDLGNVYPLGELEKKGGLLLAETVQENFSLPVFGYFYDPTNFDYHQLKSKKFFSRVFWHSLRGNIKTDLKWYDLALLYLRLNKLNDNAVRVKDFQGETADFFKDKVLRGESYSIEILNSTDHFGLAQRVSQLLEKAGARVIRIADSSEPQEDCLLSASKDLSKRYTFSWLSLVFGCQVKYANEKIGRADFTLIISEKYWKKLNEKW